MFLVDLYFSKSVFHQYFKCFKILTILEFLFQALSMIQVNKFTTFSRDLVLDRLEMLMEEMSLIKSLMNNFSFLLPLLMECLQMSVCYSSIRMVIVRGA